MRATSLKDEAVLATAIIEEERVMALTPAAAREGVRLGMRRNSALTMLPSLTVLARDRRREAQAFEAAAQALLQYTPRVACLDPHVVLLDVGAGLRAFGGVRGLVSRVRGTLRGLGFAARVGMAPTAQGAWLLARAGVGMRRIVRPRRLPGVLDRLPCSLLPEAGPHADWLRDIGCRTIGGLTRLPREGLQQRTSPALVQRLDQAYGRMPAVFEWVQAPAVFDQRLELPERTADTGLVLLAARHLLERLCAWLAVHQDAATGLDWAFEHERGRHACPPTPLRLRLGAPASRPEHLERLVQERLGTLALAAQVIVVRLTVRECVPLGTPSGVLFTEPGGTAADQSRLLELLTARLGASQVLQPSPRQDHRPELANRWLPVDIGAPAGTGRKPVRARQCRPSQAGATHAPSAMDKRDPLTTVTARQVPERPFWLLPQPLPLTAAGERPLHHGMPLRVLHGPERVEAGWWDGPLAARDYFIAEDTQHARLWIYRERGVAPPSWFLHGMFA